MLMVVAGVAPVGRLHGSNGVALFWSSSVVQESATCSWLGISLIACTQCTLCALLVVQSLAVMPCNQVVVGWLPRGSYDGHAVG